MEEEIDEQVVEEIEAMVVKGMYGLLGHVKSEKGEEAQRQRLAFITGVLRGAVHGLADFLFIYLASLEGRSVADRAEAWEGEEREQRDLILAKLQNVVAEMIRPRNFPWFGDDRAGHA